MGKRKVRLNLDGIEVIGIRCRIDTHANQGYLYYNDAQKLDPCVYCLAPSQTWEHITPRGLGGGDGWDNIARACRDCNFRRDIKPFLIFILERNIES